MKKIFGLVIGLVMVCMLVSCSSGEMAQYTYEKEAKQAAYTSNYAKTVNKLEMKEGNFKTYRRVIFYNTRLGENVFACEGYCHVKVDTDGDVELVLKVGEDEYVRHYLGKSENMTYWSEQLKPNEADNTRYRVSWNPKLWVPQFGTFD